MLTPAGPADRLGLTLGLVEAAHVAGHFGTDLGGVERRAVDLDWSCGPGDLISGTAQDIIILVIAGRMLSAGRLTGEAAARFTRRS